MSSTVFEGLTIDRAFKGLKKLKIPIGTLYVISHGVFGEVDPTTGNTLLKSTTDIAKRIGKAAKMLGEKAPQRVFLLSCYGGGRPQSMKEIGTALGTKAILAPVQETVISGRTIKITTESGKKYSLTKKLIKNISNEKLKKYIKQIDALKYYDFVPGVPHPRDKDLSKEEKLNNLVIILRKTGMIPFISFNAAPGTPGAVPYWKVKIEKRDPAEEIDLLESLGMKGVIEVTIPETTP